MNVIKFTTNVSEFPNFPKFRQLSPNFGSVRKFTSIRKSTGTDSKRVATGSVSKDTTHVYWQNIESLQLKT